jgi:hypothetical protein
MYMTNKHFIFKMAAAAYCFAGLAACTSEIDPTVDNNTTGNRPIVLTGSVQDLVASRAANNLQGAALDATATAGIFVTTDNTEYATITNGANNQLTVTNGTTLTPANEMWWGENKSLYFFAYAPYNEDYTLSSTAAFAVKDNQADNADYIASDLLYGTPSTNPVEAPTNASTPVNIVFKHKLSKVSITLVNYENNGIEFNNTKVTLLNVKNQVDLNLKSGDITDAYGDASELVITEAAVSETANSAVVVPQTIAKGQFVRVDNNGYSYFCELAADQTFESGKAYAYTIYFKLNKISTVECEVTDWTEGSSNELTDPKKEAQKSYIYYEVGDFVTKDGKLVKKEDATSQSEDIVGVIFATGDELSATDKGDGYTAYVLGLYTLDKAKVYSTSDKLENLFGEDYPLTAESKLDAVAADLDGLKYTKYIQSQSDYATTYPFFDLSSSNLNTFDSGSFSDWFIPTAGQMIQILVNLGKVEVPVTESSKNAFCVLPGGEDDGSTPFNRSNMDYIYIKAPTYTDIVNTLNSAANGKTIFNNSDVYSFSTTFVNNTNAYLLKFYDDFTTPSGSDAVRANGWGFTNGALNNNRARIACIATKLSLTEEVEVTE